MTKPTQWYVRPAKTQISLGLCPVWSESSLCTQWVAKDPRCHHGTVKTDQIGRMPWLIWVFPGRTDHLIGFVMLWLKCAYAATQICGSLSEASSNSLYCVSEQQRVSIDYVNAQACLRLAGSLCGKYPFHMDRPINNGITITDPPHDKTNKVACAPREDSDQPGHPPSLIRVFAVCLKKHWALSYPLSTLWSLWSDWTDAQADLSLCWARISLVLSWGGSYADCYFCCQVREVWSSSHVCYYHVSSARSSLHCQRKVNIHLLNHDTVSFSLLARKRWLWTIFAHPERGVFISRVFLNWSWYEVMRKLVLVICEQERCRSACASTQSDQHLCCSLLRLYNTSTCQIQNFKTS